MPRPKLSLRLGVGPPLWSQSRLAVVRPQTWPDRPSPDAQPDSLAIFECQRRRALPALAGSSADENQTGHRRGESESVRGCCPLSRHWGRVELYFATLDSAPCDIRWSRKTEAATLGPIRVHGAIPAGQGVKISPSAPNVRPSTPHLHLSGPLACGDGTVVFGTGPAHGLRWDSLPQRAAVPAPSRAWACRSSLRFPSSRTTWCDGCRPAPRRP